MVNGHPTDRRTLTIVTAGHVDHGKSALVEALTGQHPDRLPEERERSMTIALGFAATDLPDGTTLSLIDVPGHERLIEVMIAGAGGVDAALLVVAADDGPMPQTDEHLDVLRLLGVPRLVVAISRIDLVEPNRLDEIVTVAAEYVAIRGWPHSPVVATSARTGRGVDELRTEIGRIPVRAPGWGTDEPTWLPLDRSFTIRGAGAVVTGTLQRGTVSVGQRVHLGSGTIATVRGLHRHGSSIPVARAGSRVAVNLASLTGSVPARGDTLSDRPIPWTRSVIARLDLLDGTVGARPDETLRVLGGAWSGNARLRSIRPTGDVAGPRLVRIRFEEPVAVAPGERLIVRRPAPSVILAGMIVLDRAPPRSLSADGLVALAALAAGDPVPAILSRTGRMPEPAGDVLADLPADARPALDLLVASGALTALSVGDDPSASRTGNPGWLIRTTTLRGLVERITAALERQTTSHPQLPELSRTGFGTVVDIPTERIEPILDWAERRFHLLSSGPTIRLPGARPTIPHARQPTVDALLLSAASAPGWLARPPDELDPATLAVLEREARGVTMPDGRFVLGERFDGFVTWLLAALRTGPIGLRAVADGLGVGRDAAQALLESTDRLGLTVRDGDRRVPGPAAAHWRRQRVERRRRRLGIAVLGADPVDGVAVFGGVAGIVVLADDDVTRAIGRAIGREVTVIASDPSARGSDDPLPAEPDQVLASRVVLCPIGHAAGPVTIAARDVGVRLLRQGDRVLFYDDLPDRVVLRDGHPGDAVGALAECGLGMPRSVVVQTSPSNETVSGAMIVPARFATVTAIDTDVADDGGMARRIFEAGRRWAGIDDGTIRLWTLSDHGSGQRR